MEIKKREVDRVREWKRVSKWKAENGQRKTETSWKHYAGEYSIFSSNAIDYSSIHAMSAMSIRTSIQIGIRHSLDNETGRKNSTELALYCLVARFHAICLSLSLSLSFSVSISPFGISINYPLRSRVRVELDMTNHLLIMRRQWRIKNWTESKAGKTSIIFSNSTWHRGQQRAEKI